MANPTANKRKGYLWQKDIVKGLRQWNYETEELTLSGKDDEGDIGVRLSARRRLMIEAKYTAMTPAHMDEAIVERMNYAKARGLQEDQVETCVLYRRRGKPGLGAALAVIPFPEYLALLDIKAQARL